MIAIIDYDAGNLNSVCKALEYLGKETVVTRDPAVILSSDRVILPGVGAFGEAMKRLYAYGLVPVIREAADTRPFLGICLGLQLLFEKSEESPGVAGLGILKGEILRIPDAPGLKVPHIGWNSLDICKEHPLFEGVCSPYVYFVHSYYLHAAEREIVTATAQYGVQIDASVQKGRLFACQFHPEKSGEAGLRILKNFTETGA